MLMLYVIIKLLLIRKFCVEDSKCKVADVETMSHLDPSDDVRS